MKSAKNIAGSQEECVKCEPPQWVSAYGVVSAALLKNSSKWAVLQRMPWMGFLIALSFNFFAPMGSAWAVDDREIVFMGQPVIPRPGVYLVTKDVNVRAKPDTKAKKVGSFGAGTRVQIIGRAKGSWLAARTDGKDVGFVYGPVLVPLLPNPITQPMIGKASFALGECDYTVVFDGDSEIEGQKFVSFDYHIRFECRHEGRSYSFGAPMFISEGPFNSGRKPIYQIGIDVLELAQDYDRFFSTNVLFDRDKSQVRFDSASVKKYRMKKAPDPVSVSDVSDALRAGIGLSLQSWSPAFWRDIAKALKPGSAQ